MPKALLTIRESLYIHEKVRDNFSPFYLNDVQAFETPLKSSKLIQKTQNNFGNEHNHILTLFQDKCLFYSLL